MDDNNAENLGINDELSQSDVNINSEKQFEENQDLILNVMDMHFAVGEIFWTMSSGKKMGSKRLHLTKLLAYAMGFAMMSSIALFI